MSCLVPGTGQCTDGDSITFTPLARPVLWLSYVENVKEGHWSETAVTGSRREAKNTEFLSQGPGLLVHCGGGFPTEERITLGYAHLA